MINILGRLEVIVPGALLGQMSVLFFVQVVNRYFIKYPIDWIEKLVIYVYILGAYLELYQWPARAGTMKLCL